MGFFTGLNNQARLNGAYLNAMGKFEIGNELGLSKLNGKKFGRDVIQDGGINQVLLDKGKGYVQQQLESEYGLNTDNAQKVFEAINKFGEHRAAPAGGVPRKYFTNDAKNDINNAFNNNNKQRMAGTALNDLGIDISPESNRKRSSDRDRIKLGDKDKRSFLAEEKLRIANGLVGGSNTRDELVDKLNANGFQTNPKVLDAYNNDDRLNAVHNMDADNYFVRPEFESPSFVGEGQFGRVSELAPGYVSKTQEPLVEFGGYQMSEDGSMSPKGNLIGRIYDYRDVIDDANQLNYLNKKHITPKVENLIIDEDGSTEMIMKDLRTNYDTSQDYNDSIFNEYNDPNTSAPRRAQLLKDQNLYKVRQAQQEATAASAGIELQDRHQENILINKMTKRPMQIDPSGIAVEGIERDAVIAQQVVNGLGDAGLTDEADIFAGLITEAGERGDQSAIHDLAQQGMSRLMKIKKVL